MLLCFRHQIKKHFLPWAHAGRQHWRNRWRSSKLELPAIGDMRPGSLSTQYNVCGKAGCRCKATPPEKHGPYYQVSYTRKGKSSSKFVTKEDLPVVHKQLKNYKRMKLLMERWIDLATELSTLRLIKETD